MDYNQTSLSCLRRRRWEGSAATWNYYELANNGGGSVDEKGSQWVWHEFIVAAQHGSPINLTLWPTDSSGCEETWLARSQSGKQRISLIASQVCLPFLNYRLRALIHLDMWNVCHVSVKHSIWPVWLWCNPTSAPLQPSFPPAELPVIVPVSCRMRE